MRSNQERGLRTISETFPAPLARDVISFPFRHQSTSLYYNMPSPLPRRRANLRRRAGGRDASSGWGRVLAGSNTHRAPWGPAGREGCPCAPGEAAPAPRQGRRRDAAPPAPSYSPATHTKIQVQIWKHYMFRSRKFSTLSK